ncbi:ribosomal protein l44 [Fusarium langsethiae]|uniref:Large ribosomal subunit protein mL53 n=2 Tax=Fusarium sambucinum species complex TaxID=569360 RepID=A0A0M9F3X8_FUSLA|nr:ribosomal protein l44 [Fusarium langsethiae]GKT99690.1 unnamed protein product [Fusarium langsethiae]GKU10472.1 unnamed protein product [Fusarium langsethiae]
MTLRWSNDAPLGQYAHTEACINDHIRHPHSVDFAELLAHCASAAEMITKFMTEVSAKFNPFSTCAKPARLFLTLLPPNARANGTTITSAILPRNSQEPSSLRVKFKDGKELNFDCQKVNIKGLVEEVDRHSRQLQKAADLTD